MKTLSAREASMFACLTDTVVAPAGMLPSVRDTDAALFFDDWLSRAPKINALGLRAMIVAAELAPFAFGFRGRLRQLSEADRAAFLTRVEKHPAPPVRQLTKLVKGLAFLSYYGDSGVMCRLGYDASAVVARGRELRVVERRP